MDEKEAINRLLKKDLEGLTWLMEIHQVKALRVAVLITQDKDLAEDVVQSKFVDLFRRIQNYDQSRPFAPWFMRGVINAAITATNATRRTSNFSDLPFDPEHWMDSTPLPETKAMQAEFAQHVKISLQELSPQQRGAVVMRYFLEMSDAEIAEVANVPEGTIKWRLYAARNRLRKLLSFSAEKEEF
jgi:RNA polymerase sigma-70 factor (ECF subfamily)